MKMKTITVVIVFGITLYSCNQSTKETGVAATDISSLQVQSPNQPNDNNDKTSQVSLADSTGVPVPESNKNKPNTLLQPDWDKKIIKTATLKLEVKNFKDYNAGVFQTVKKFGGYIAQEQQNITDEMSETVVAIKVPVAQFEDLMNSLPGDSKVVQRQINTDDVTEELVDTKSRLEARKQMRLKYLDFLKQTKNMEEALLVQGEVNDIQEEIESAAGRINYLSHQSALSTINLTFYQIPDGVKVPSNQSPSFVARIVSAFVAGAKWMGELLISLIYVWPLLLVLAGVWVFWKRQFLQKK